MRLRSAASGANLLKGCGLELAHSARPLPAVARDPNGEATVTVDALAQGESLLRGSVSVSCLRGFCHDGELALDVGNYIERNACDAAPPIPSPSARPPLSLMEKTV